MQSTKSLLEGINSPVLLSILEGDKPQETDLSIIPGFKSSFLYIGFIPSFLATAK